MKTLLIDNYDSFTFNLYQALAELSGRAPVVIRNDELDQARLRAEEFDAIVISPGPGRPDNERNFGTCAQVIREWNRPLLGVCLGHQGICCSFGGSVIHAPEPVHGRISRIHHDGSGLFAGIAQGFEAVRYHSLIAEEPLPECLEKIAWTEDGLIMGLRHRSKPIWGVQFHPESISTISGRAILANFYRMSAEFRGVPWPSPPVAALVTARDMPSKSTGEEHRVFVKKIPGVAPPELAFRQIFSHSRYGFWLDSSMVNGREGRFSFIGGVDPREFKIVRYNSRERKVLIDTGDHTETVDQDLFSYLNAVLSRKRILTSELPFDFNCGYVGYFGYELKADCGGKQVHESPHPDAILLFVGRQIVFDFRENVTYLLWYGAAGAKAQADAWFAEMQLQLCRLQDTIPPTLHVPDPPELIPVQSRASYIKNISKALSYIRDGESYEVCLTNKWRGSTTANPLDYYSILRSVNPAPYSAFLRFGKLAVACSSPERFLRIAPNMAVETKPIKGTACRGRTEAEDAALRLGLSRDVKSGAENLMIVDLMRNDLGRVCEIGSVAVPALMNVETYATVHQLVSTVTGRLRSGYTAVDCLRHAFPGGSMTGAPKLRTLDIIDELESEARGIYSGSIGYLALNGSADLNIVIRTAVFQDGDVSIGTGGAIVALSDPEQEWEELLLKTNALVTAFEMLAKPRSEIAAQMTRASNPAVM